MMGVSNEIVKSIEKSIPDIRLNKPYDGKFLKYILEYVNIFIVPDAKIKNLDENIKNDILPNKSH